MSSETQQPRKSPRLLMTAALVLSLSITLGSIFFIIYRMTTQTTDTGAAVIDPDNYFDGSTTIDPPRQLSDFTLTGKDGQPLSLSDLRGKVTLLAFGYTNCPDVCPVTMGDFERIKTMLDADAADVNFLLVSVDGIRDTPDVMQRYINAFDPDFLGMTGTADDLRRIGGDYGLYFRANAEQNGNYTVDHTSGIFMIDREGFLRTIFVYGTEPDVVTGYVRELL
jgi:protein SCO1/2